MGEDKHEVVGVGGGYAGAVAAVRVAGRLRGRGRVTLVDPRAELVQRLRLHQAAAGQRVRSYALGELIGRRVEHVRASAHEELVTRSAVPSIRMERRMPGSLRWLRGGAPVADLEPATG